MRFMMLMIPGGYEKAAPDTTPSLDAIEKMMKYNYELGAAGVLVSLDGLRPLSSGARVSFATGEPVVTDGPFVETKEAIGGYWILNVKSKEEAIAWAKKCPASANETLEIRPFFELEDFPQDVQDGARHFDAQQEKRLQGKSNK
jgi:hypothetical protein